MNQLEVKRFTYQDITWVLSLFGTAVGAGILFLPIRAGANGFWPLVILAVIATPMIWYAHKGLARFVLSGSQKESDITDVVEEFFGVKGATVITFAYFFAIYPIVLIYGVSVTTVVNSFIEHQLGYNSPPRWLTAGVMVALMTAGISFGRNLMLQATSIVVYPLVIILFILSILLIPEWNTSMITAKTDWSVVPSAVWLAIPLIVFSFNHSPIISQFAKDHRQEFGDLAYIKTDRITGATALMLTGFVMFFVFSVVLSLTPEELMQAKERNIDVLSHISSIHNSKLIIYAGPIIAFTAIVSSYFGHFLGAHEGLVGLVKEHTKIPEPIIGKFSMLAIAITTWIAAIINPSVLGMMETLGTPMIAAILFILPVYAMKKIPQMKKYRTPLFEQVFTWICGIAAITSVIYNILLSFL